MTYCFTVCLDETESRQSIKQDFKPSLLALQTSAHNTQTSPAVRRFTDRYEERSSWMISKVFMAVNIQLVVILMLKIQQEGCINIFMLTLSLVLEVKCKE